MNIIQKELLYRFLHKNFQKLSPIRFDTLIQLDLQYLIEQLDNPELKVINLPDNIEQQSCQIEIVKDLSQIDYDESIIAQLAGDYCLKQLELLPNFIKLLSTFRVQYQIPNSIYQEGKQIFQDNRLNEISNILPLSVFTRYKYCYLVNFCLNCSKQDNEQLNQLLKFNEKYLNYSQDDEEFKLSVSKSEHIISELSLQLILPEYFELLVAKYFLRPFIEKSQSLQIDQIMAKLFFVHLKQNHIFSSSLILNIEDIVKNEQLQILSFQLQQQLYFRQDMIQLLKSQLNLVSQNYVQQFCLDFKNFHPFLEILRFFHTQIQNKKNFDVRLEKLIVSSVIKQFQLISQEFNHNSSKQGAVLVFKEFLKKFYLEIQPQIDIFLPVINNFHSQSRLCGVFNINSQFNLSDVNFVGTTSETQPQGQQIISCYTAFSGSIIKLLYDSLILIKQNWFIENGILFRVNIQSLQEILQLIQQIFIKFSSKVQDYFDKAILLQLTYPLISTIIQAEFDHIQHIISTNKEDEFIIQDQKKEVVISSFVADSITLISTVFSEIIGKFNINIDSYQLLFSGLLSQIKQIFVIFNKQHQLVDLEESDFNDGKSIQKKWKGKILFDPSKIQNPGLAAIYNQNIEEYNSIVKEKTNQFQRSQSANQNLRTVIMRMNSLVKLQSEIELLFASVGNDVNDGYTLLLRNGLQNQALDQFTDFKQRIQEQLQNSKKILSSDYSQYFMQEIIFIWQQVYCPVASTKQLVDIVNLLTNQFEIIHKSSIIQVNIFLIQQMLIQFQRYYYQLLTDSGLRARSIGKEDYDILSTDFMYALTQFGKYTDDDFLNDTFKQIVDILSLHNLHTKDLKIKADGGDMLSFKVICFRRYCDDDVRKWLIERKKSNKQ
ncbi:hypothetical protein SS50377_22565 [Spironucleus salmonicida]|uniref:Uncharacterized protein n=1 Tax=Spironucleus salmonicida TaxID=348837 RepID=V6LCG5_9EUKA|nr:hypothetical protein SS50377_22565 [Spironucleus salmonicida]|eukprot:EST41943.1 Hypothetical protein SS50377_18247 [Spironucleus salmonicida]